jgi:hypothetical protein
LLFQTISVIICFYNDLGDLYSYDVQNREMSQVLRRNVIAGNDQLRGMYQAIKMKQFQIDGEIDKMRVTVTGMQGNRQGELVVQV